MKSLLFVLSQLSLVTLVYAFAYRAGYRSAQSKAMSVVSEFADPVTCLLDQLNGSTVEPEEDERPNRRGTSKHLSASGGVNIAPSTSDEKDVEF